MASMDSGSLHRSELRDPGSSASPGVPARRHPRAKPAVKSKPAQQAKTGVRKNSSQTKQEMLRRGVNNVVDGFSEQKISEWIVEYMIQKGLIEEPESDQRKKIEDELAKNLGEEFPEISNVQTLRRQFHFAISGRKKPFEPRKVKRVEHLMAHYADELREGYLPIPEIKDENLRDSLATAKAHGQLPELFAAVCLTKAEVLAQRQSAINTILAAPQALARQVASFLMFYQLRRG